MRRLPRETKADVAKRHACHTKVLRRLGAQARHQSQPSPISTTPATVNEVRCRQVPRLPRETTVDVAKCRACHAKVPRRHGAQACHQGQPSPISAAPATWNDGGCRQVPWQSCVWQCCNKVVCDNVYVTKLCVWQSCMWQSCVCDKVICDKVVCDKVVCDKVVCDNVYVRRRRRRGGGGGGCGPRGGMQI